MKLHLPSRLRSSVLLCLSAFSALSSTLSTGILSSSAVVISLAASPAKGATIVDKTFEYAGTTYSGAELVTLDVSNTANVAAGGASHAISGVANMTVTLDVDGTPTDKKMTDKVHALNSTAYCSDNYNYEIWKSFCSSNVGRYGYGQTMKLAGADTAWTLTLDFTPIEFGGLITEAATDSGSYSIGRTWSALNITGNETAGANMHINAATTLVSNGTTVNTSGSWVLNKDLSFASATTVAAGKEITLSGEGTLNIGGSLTMNAGSRIVGENNAINATGTLTLNLSGLTSGAAPLISTGGAVAANGFTLANYSSLAAGEYALISTTDSSASALASLFTTKLDRYRDYSVSNKNGLVLLTVREVPNLIFTSMLGESDEMEMAGYGTILFANIHSPSYNGGAISNSGTFSMNDNEAVTFSGNNVYYSTSSYSNGGAIYNTGTFSMNDNEAVTFSGNTSSSSGGAIANYGTFTLSGNGDVTFSRNRSSYGGAIRSRGTFTLSNNGNVTFCDNSASGYGGALYNSSSAVMTLSGNETISFSGNTSSLGGAIVNDNGSDFSIIENGAVSFNGNSVYSSSRIQGGAIFNNSDGNFTISGNGGISFCGNSVSSDSGTTAVYGGAIYNTGGTFTLSGNGDVLFEKNYEHTNGTYRLRSIYSTGGTLNLSASESKSIMFKDSVYASGTVNLNQGGTGDIIFTGVSTEADLRAVKGGIDGTAEEILNSCTSELATNAKLYGGRLIVEDGAILKGCGITVTEGANATVRLNGATLDETGYAIAVSSGSGLEFVRENTLAASAVSLANNSFLNFNLDEAQTSVNWDANLDIQGGLSLNLTHEDKPVHDTYALLAMQSDNTVTGWDTANLSINGAASEHLMWENNTLYYRPMLVQENGDTTLDKDVETEAAGGTIGGKDDVNIDGNGHSLTVKNAVQLVQMALKNGTVKLEGENNGIVSVTLTEGGELVLTAGAGLKTGDIISMVANGKGELVISGDITLDEHGMKGKAGSMASVSNMNATTTGDAVFENVAFTDSLLDIGEGTTATFKNAVLGAGTRVTDAPATAKFENTLALLDSTNTEVVTESTTEALRLYMSGDTTNAVTLDAGAALVDLTCTVFDTITLSGSDLYLDLTALAVTLGDADAFSLTFTNGTLAAIDADSLHIYATLDGEHYLAGYTTQQGGLAEKVYFTTSASVPEPATATLSLLALAALAARRRRK